MNKSVVLLCNSFLIRLNAIECSVSKESTSYTLKLIDRVKHEIYRIQEEAMHIDANIDRVKSRDYKAFLNGQEVQYCAAADEENGWVDVYLKDANGNFFLAEPEETEDGGFKSSGVARFRLYGQVELRRIDEQS